MKWTTVRQKTNVAAGRQDMQVIADARQVRLVSVYAMDNLSSFVKLATNIIQMFSIEMVDYW